MNQQLVLSVLTTAFWTAVEHVADKYDAYLNSDTFGWPSVYRLCVYKGRGEGPLSRFVQYDQLTGPEERAHSKQIRARTGGKRDTGSCCMTRCEGWRGRTMSSRSTVRRKSVSKSRSCTSSITRCDTPSSTSRPSSCSKRHTAHFPVRCTVRRVLGGARYPNWAVDERECILSAGFIHALRQGASL